MLYLRRTKEKYEKGSVIMDYAITNFKSREIDYLEAIKKAVVKDNKFLVNEAILEDFIKDLRGKTNATKESYYKGAKYFISYCNSRGIDKVEERDITNYYNYLVSRIGKPKNEDGLTINSVNMFLTSLRKLYKYLEKKGIKNLASNLESVKSTRSHKKDPLTKSQALELLRSQDRTTEEGKRNYALLTLLLHTGLRTIEIERANVGDLRTKGSKQVLEVQGKGHKEKDDYVKLSPVVYEAILDYLATRKDAKPNDPLFISYSNRTKESRLKTRSIREIVKKCLEEIGVNSPRITTHSLRHSAITFSLLGGATLQEAQTLARHENINTTLIYAHNLDKLNSNYEEAVDNFLDA